VIFEEKVVVPTKLKTVLDEKNSRKRLEIDATTMSTQGLAKE
jgi:hypothetical protein